MASKKKASKKKSKQREVVSTQDQDAELLISNPIVLTAAVLLSSVLATGFGMLSYFAISQWPRYQGGNVGEWCAEAGFVILMSTLFIGSTLFFLVILAASTIRLFCICSRCNE